MDHDLYFIKITTSTRIHANVEEYKLVTSASRSTILKITRERNVKVFNYVYSKKT